MAVGRAVLRRLCEPAVRERPGDSGCRARALAHRYASRVRRGTGRTSGGAGRCAVVCTRHSGSSSRSRSASSARRTYISSRASRANRRTPGHGGIILAPSTAPDVGQGFLITHSRLVGEPGIAPGATALGRAWDAGVKAGTWQAGTSPNGLAVVRDSEIGAHIGPWSASTSRRPFDASSNRLSEFNNRP